MITDKEKEERKAARLDKKYIYPWVGFDLDGTLAEYHTFVSPTHIGEPIQPIVEKLNWYLDQGMNVKIFTARLSEEDPMIRLEILQAIDAWTTKVFGKALPVTCIKDYGMIRLYDDRAVQVETNTGRIIGD